LPENNLAYDSNKFHNLLHRNDEALLHQLLREQTIYHIIIWFHVLPFR